MPSLGIARGSLTGKIVYKETKPPKRKGQGRLRWVTPCTGITLGTTAPMSLRAVEPGRPTPEKGKTPDSTSCKRKRIECQPLKSIHPHENPLLVEIPPMGGQSEVKTPYGAGAWLSFRRNRNLHFLVAERLHDKSTGRAKQNINEQTCFGAILTARPAPRPNGLRNCPNC